MTFGRLFLGFIVFAVLEVAVMSAVADVIGWPLTLVLLIATGLIGSALFRLQGRDTLQRLNQRVQAGEMPGRELMEGAALLIGSVCLITPGFITDTMGFLLLIPITRRGLARWLLARGSVQLFSGFGPSGFGFKQTGSGGPGFYRTGNVYEGEAQVVPRSSANDADSTATLIELPDQSDKDTDD